jgi:mannose-6-phosphate isomerase-like protein (cupin superfamily)
MTAGMTAAVVRPGEGRRVSVLGVDVEILLTGQETGGAYSLYRMIIAPGAGAPPHVHRGDDEAFTVVEGAVECGCGDQILTLEAGATVFLPKGIPHYFRGIGETPSIVYGMATPAGHDGFFEEASQLSFPPDPAEVAAICARHGIELLPPPVEGH